RVSSSGRLGRQRAFRPARIPTEGPRRGPRRNKARLQRCRKPNPAASLQPAQSWWISLGRKSHARIGAEAACHRTYGLVLGADLNCSESRRLPVRAPKDSTVRYGGSAALQDFDLATV